MSVLAIDPGCAQSGYVVFDGTRVLEAGVTPNEALALRLVREPWADVVMEQIESFGMAVGREVFETVFWTGRFYEAVQAGRAHRVTRRAVKLHLCQSPRAKDANIRQALIDRFGGRLAIGTKAAPGPLYGVRSHAWAALAVAVTWWETHQAEGR